MKRYGVLGWLLVLGICSACTSAEAKLGQRILDSDLALGIMLDQSAAQVNAVLGQPTAQISRQDGNVVEEYYLPEKVTTTDAKTPQLSLTFAGDKLVRVYNYYEPTDEEKPNPPFFFEILPGVKLGNRRSDLVSTLGEPMSEVQGMEWRFTLKSGRQVAIMARFVEIEEIKEEWCTMLSLTLTDKVDATRGEYYDNKQKAMDQARGKSRQEDRPQDKPVVDGALPEQSDSGDDATGK